MSSAPNNKTDEVPSIDEVRRRMIAAGVPSEFAGIAIGFVAERAQEAYVQGHCRGFDQGVTWQQEREQRRQRERNERCRQAAAEIEQAVKNCTVEDVTFSGVSLDSYEKHRIQEHVKNQFRVWWTTWIEPPLHELKRGETDAEQRDTSGHR